jgi:hypothetical protein
VSALVAVPIELDSLFVARACTVCMPGTSSSTGNWMRPPPPTTASTQPAAKAARISRTTVVPPSETRVVEVMRLPRDDRLRYPEFLIRHAGRRPG